MNSNMKLQNFRSDPSGKSLLLYIHVPVYKTSDGELMIEPQAANGLRLWASHFSDVTVMQPLMTDIKSTKNLVSISKLPEISRIDFDPLPEAYRPDRFFREFFRTKQKIRENIEKSDYLCFSLGGLFGDWGAVSSIMAHRMKRRYSIWTDRVESQVVRHHGKTGRGRAALRSRLSWRPMAILERWVINRASLGLFHGRETYDAYAPFCRQPELVHDLHVSKADHIDPDDLVRKQEDVPGNRLRIVYAGRADAMKGPLDWVETLAIANENGVDFHATWLGDGPLLTDMRTAVEKAGLKDKVDLPGFVSDRRTVLRSLRQAHIMMFCHKTPESPRCLMEALLSGTPLLGYKGAFAADLISGHGGGQLVDMNDVAALADSLIGLDKNRTRLADLMKRAVRDSALFYDEAVFAHRAGLIRKYL